MKSEIRVFVNHGLGSLWKSRLPILGLPRLNLLRDPVKIKSWVLEIGDVPGSGELQAIAMCLVWGLRFNLLGYQCLRRKGWKESFPKWKTPGGRWITRREGDGPKLSCLSIYRFPILFLESSQFFPGITANKDLQLTAIWFVWSFLVFHYTILCACERLLGLHPLRPCCVLWFTGSLSQISRNTREELVNVMIEVSWVRAFCPTWSLVCPSAPKAVLGTWGKSAHVCWVNERA